MRQYLDAKRQYRDAIVFFRMGDFYEMFYEDALVGGARARADADVAVEGRRRQRHPDVRRAVSRGRRLRRAARAARASASPSASRSRIRRRPRGWSSARSSASSRPARSPTPTYLEAREPAFLMAIVPTRAADAVDASASALLDLSTGEFTRRRVPRRATACRRWPTRSRCCGRARSSCRDGLADRRDAARDRRGCSCR